MMMMNMKQMMAMISTGDDKDQDDHWSMIIDHGTDDSDEEYVAPL